MYNVPALRDHGQSSAEAFLISNVLLNVKWRAPFHCVNEMM